jgi:hypothetical protein
MRAFAPGPTSPRPRPFAPGVSRESGAPQGYQKESAGAMSYINGAHISSEGKSKKAKIK